MAKYLKIILLILHITIFAFTAKSQEIKQSSGIRYFSGEKVFPVIFLDPLESQVSGGAYYITEDNYQLEELIMLNHVNLGFNRPVFTWKTEKYDYEICLETTAFSLFQISRSELDNKLLGGLMNIDFKVGASYGFSSEVNSFRIRYFHVSSHFGDDYIFRNSITLPNDRSGNYEQIDFTWLRAFNTSYVYAGAGGIISKYVYRERLSFWSGAYLTQVTGRERLSLFESLNIRLIQEYSYNPDIRIVIGLNIMTSSKPAIRLWIEYYNGYLPYGVFHNKTSWFGLGASMTL